MHRQDKVQPTFKNNLKMLEKHISVGWDGWHVFLISLLR